MMSLRWLVLCAACLVVGGHVADAGVEHPRLFFQKSDVAALRAKARTPEGVKLMRRLKALCALDTNGFKYNPANAAYPYAEGFWATGHALLYLLEGNASELKRSMEVEDLAMDLSGGEWGGWGSAHKLAGAAMAYDLAAEHWAPDYRLKVRDFLVRNSTVRWGQVPKDSNRGMMFAGASALAALAVYGETDDDAGLKAQLDQFETYLRVFLRYGIGDKGWPNEWHGHAEMQDVVQATLQGYRNVMGRDIAHGTGFESYGILGVATGGKVMGDMGGCWAGVTMGLAPANLRPALRWTIEQYNVNHDTLYESRDNHVYHVRFPHHALFALIYAVDIPPVDPSSLLPPVLHDQGMNSFVFRGGYTGNRNFMTLLDGQMRSEMAPVLAYDMALMAFGGTWLRGRRPSGIGEWHIETDSCVSRTHACPCVPKVDGLMPFHGARLLHFSSASDGSGLVTLTTDHYVEGTVRKSYFSTRADARVIPDTTARGVELLRSVAVDYSGTSGAPVLVSVYDRFTGTGGRGKSVQWNFGSGKGVVAGVEPAGRLNDEMIVQKLTGGKVAFRGSRLAGLSETTVQATWVLPADVALSYQASRHGANLTGGVVWSGGSGDDHWVVFTVQEGTAPAVRKEGRTVTVGDQTIWFDGEKLVLGTYGGKVVKAARGPLSGPIAPVGASVDLRIGQGMVVGVPSGMAADVAIYNLRGRVVASLTIKPEAGSGRIAGVHRVAVSGGAYVVRTSTGAGVR